MFFRWFNNVIIQNTKISRFNLVAVGIIGFTCHPLYWAIYTYIFPQDYNNSFLRFSAAFLCLPLIFVNHWPKIVRSKILPTYWFFTISYILPFVLSFHFFMNPFSEIWMMIQVAMFFMVAIFISQNFILMLLNLIIGVGSAILFISYLHPNILIFNPYYLESLPIFLFAIIGGYIFNYLSIKGAQNEKESVLKSLSGSIAHEVRNPLGSINFSSNQILNITSKIKLNLSDSQHDLKFKDKMMEIEDIANNSISCIKRAGGVVNMILDNINGVNSDKSGRFLNLSSKDLLEKAILEYSYNNNSEKNAVRLDSREIFVISGYEDSLIYVIFNLIKNSVYYLKDFPNLKIDISSKRGDGKYNYILVSDNGPGVGEDNLAKIFDDFSTFGKKGGTGLGLSFCKKVMKDLGGDIKCISNPGHTKFLLLFPKINLKKKGFLFRNFYLLKMFQYYVLSFIKKEKYGNKTSARNAVLRDIARSKIVNYNKKRLNQDKLSILLVDDQLPNIFLAKKSIKKYFNDVVIKTANDGKEAVDVVRSNRNLFDFILMDIEMPNMDGIEATKIIRRVDKNIPIIAHTSLHNFRQKALDCGMNDYMQKTGNPDFLVRAISRWNIIKADPFPNIGIDQVKKMLSNKRVLFAEDELTNRLILSSYLKNLDVEVHEAVDGKDLVDKFVRNTAKGNFYDAIITDIRMPIIGGVNASKIIRDYQKRKDLNHIPIIAVGGDSEKEKIHDFLKTDIDEYFVKGSDIDYFVKVLTFWIGKNDQKIG